MLIGNRLSKLLPGHTTEYKFDDKRKWRFDFAYPDLKLAIEAEGGVWSRGRHTRGSGYIKDCEKYNRAAVMGWTVLRYTAKNIKQIEWDLMDFAINYKRKGGDLK